MEKLKLNSFKKYFQKLNLVPLKFFNHPWTLFILFFFLNAWMSWIPASLSARLWIFLVGFIPLFFWGIKSRTGVGSQPAWEKEIISKMAVWLGGLLLFLALGIRLYK